MSNRVKVVCRIRPTLTADGVPYVPGKADPVSVTLHPVPFTCGRVDSRYIPTRAHSTGTGQEDVTTAADVPHAPIIPFLSSPRAVCVAL